MKKTIKIVAIVLAFIFTFVAGVLVDYFVLPSGKRAIKTQEPNDICQMTRLEYSEDCNDAFDKVCMNNTYASRDELDDGLDELYDLYLDMEDDLRLAMLVDEVNGEEHYEKLAMILEQSYNTHWDSMYEQYHKQCDD